MTQSQMGVNASSRRAKLIGYVITGATALFLLFDAIVKVLKLSVAVEGAARLGYPASLVVTIGIVELLCLAAYLYPCTAFLGAVLLTGYLGGATATQARVEDLWFAFPILLGVLIWIALLLHDERLRAYIACELRRDLLRH